MYLFLIGVIEFQALPHHEQQLLAPRSFQTAGDLLVTGANARVLMSRQSLGVTFSPDNVSQDGHSSRTTDVADHVGQLDIHLRQRLLQVLDTHPRCRHQILSLPQITAQHTNLFGWPECLVQKPKVCSFCSHWHSCTSVLRPGRVLVCCACATFTSNP